MCLFAGGVGGGGWGGGGAQNSGVDPALYARQLMKLAGQYVVEMRGTRGGVEVQADPEEALAKAHVGVRILGSSTACVAVYNARDGRLRACNVGDSGFVVVRGGKLVFRSDIGQHYFNCPLQLSADGGDTAYSGDAYAIEMRDGDLVVMGTDGLFDNLFDHEVAGQAHRLVCEERVGVHEAAKRLAATAQARAAQETGSSPFAVGALAEGYMYQGGKMDDITVLVASFCAAAADSPPSD